MGDFSLDQSYYIEIKLHQEDNKAAQEHEGSSIHFTEVTNLTVNLKEHLDTLKIVENAADLNLKLMKWRQVPDLDLMTPQKTSVLLVGSGSLGC